MGTRADFYIGRGADAQWLGSIAWDGYPDGIAKPLLSAGTEITFRSALADFFAKRKDVTLPEQGWPWPWDDSRTTDYAYAFDGDRVYASCFGKPWFDPTAGAAPEDSGAEEATFPNMKDRQNIAWDSDRSGIVIVTGR